MGDWRQAGRQAGTRIKIDESGNADDRRANLSLIVLGLGKTLKYILSKARQARNTMAGLHRC